MFHVLKLLYPYLLLFYVIDCFIHIKRFQVAFTSHIGTGYKYLKEGFRFISLSPICRLYIVHQLPVFFSKEKVYIWKKTELSDADLYHPESFFRLNYQDIQNIHTDDTVLISNGKIKIDFHSSDAPKAIEEKIYVLNKTDPDKRDILIRQDLESSTRIDAIRNNRFNGSTTLSALELLSLMLFFNLFVLTPIILYTQIKIHILFPLILALILYLKIMFLSVYSVRKKIAGNKGSLPLLVLTLIFSPVTALRVIHFLTRHLLATFDYIAVSAAFLTPDDLKPLLKKELKRMHYSKLKFPDDDLTGCIQIKEAYYRRFLDASGLASEDIFRHPAKRHDDAHSYCPLCNVEFVKSATTCPDCDMDLVPFES